MMATIHKRRKVHIRGSFTFDNTAMRGLIDIAIKQWPKQVLPLYGQKTGEGFWLVGDEGVYLMHNGQPLDLREGKRQPVVYSDECNPDTTKDWWDVKRTIFGGDDGVDYIGRATIQAIVEAGHDVEICITFDNKMLIKPKGVVIQ